MSNSLAVAYGEPGLLLDDGEVQTWSAPACLLGQTILVSLLITGPLKFTRTFKEYEPEVTVDANAANRDWTSCPRLKGSRTGADRLTVGTYLFGAPDGEPPAELRVHVTFRGQQAARVLARAEGA